MMGESIPSQRNVAGENKHKRGNTRLGYKFDVSASLNSDGLGSKHAPQKHVIVPDRYMKADTHSLMRTAHCVPDYFPTARCLSFSSPTICFTAGVRQKPAPHQFDYPITPRWKSSGLILDPGIRNDVWPPGDGHGNSPP